MRRVSRRPSGLTEFGRRVVTALAYAEKNQADLADALNIDVKTLQRTLRGERDFRDAEVQTIVEYTRVPEWFLRDGFEVAPANAETLRTFYLAGVDTGLERVDTAIKDLRALVEERVGDGDRAAAQAEQTRAVLAEQSDRLAELVQLVSQLRQPPAAAAE